MSAKKIVLVAGPPATGKNYVSEKIAKALGSVAYFDKDDLVDLVNSAFKIAGKEVNRDSEFYIENIRPFEYTTIIKLAQSALNFTDIALINAPFLGELRNIEYIADLKNSLLANNIELFVAWTYTTTDIVYERMLKRNASRDKWKLENWQEYLKTVDYSVPTKAKEEVLFDNLFVIDTSTDETKERDINALITALRR